MLFHNNLGHFLFHKNKIGLEFIYIYTHGFEMQQFIPKYCIYGDVSILLDLAIEARNVTNFRKYYIYTYLGTFSGNLGFFGGLILILY